MTTPVDERPASEPKATMQTNSHYAVPSVDSPWGTSEADGTFVEGDMPSHPNSPTGVREGAQRQGDAFQRANSNHLAVNTGTQSTFTRMSSLRSPSANREQAHRLDDDLALLHIERDISNQQAAASIRHSLRRERSRHEEPIDEFDVATNPLHEKTAIYKPPENPSSKFAKFFKKIHNSMWIIRYFTYIIPMVLIILVPLLLGALVFKDVTVGGVEMAWFCIWLEIVWLTLWAGRILAKCLPWPLGTVSSIFTNNSKKWRDMSKQLELPATLFFWWLAIEISFLPTMTNHHLDGTKGTKKWEKTMNNVLVSLFVGMVLNFVEKILIQLIAISFHLRTYADRIELLKFQLGSLAKLYKFSKEKIAVEDSEFEQNLPPSGARTPGKFVKEAQKGTKEVFSRFGDVAGRVAGDFTGNQVKSSTHPQQIILALLRSGKGSQVLARRLYRTFAREDTETVHSEDLRLAFENDDEADAAFSMFDKDMNGDISMEELEAVCVEIGHERKSITASLKDLDSVVSKLDNVFMFVVFIITIIIFVSLISSSAAGAITSAGSTILALSWLFSATAQEFLQSIIFVFVKHPFDVGDRISIYGNTGALGLGDDYFVKEIALLYTEFKKVEGHVVQAPNSYLNTLFIMNQRRSGALAEAVPIMIKFGTTLEQIDTLRQRLLEFVKSEMREYQNKILTELKEVKEVHSLTLNVVFFYKSNWQNELLRLQRRNKFICALMVTIQECGIEGPRMRFPGQKESFPVYMQNLPHNPTPGVGHNGTPDNPSGVRDQESQDAPFVAAAPDSDDHPVKTHTGILRNASSRSRAESMAAMGRRVDFSLGMRDMGPGDMMDDVFEERENLTRQRQTMDRVSSPHRRSQDSGSDTGRSTSVNTNTSSTVNGLQRLNTDGSGARRRPSHHRNRLFGRGLGPHDEEMADIPEALDSDVYLDHRPGTQSSNAGRMTSNEFPPRSAGGASAVEAELSALQPDAMEMSDMRSLR